MILLALSESFYGREDRGLTTRLMINLLGILSWAVIGWARLRQRGNFLQPTTGQELLGELHDLTSPVGQFVDECCSIGPAHNVTRENLFNAYVDWAKASGRAHVEDRAGFGRALRAAAPTLRTSHRNVNDCKARFYEGMGLRLNTESWGSAEHGGTLFQRIPAPPGYRSSCICPFC